jgi:transketolase
MFLGVGAGYGYSADGPTHHSIEDYGLFNLFDEFSIVVPLSNDTAVEYFDRYVQSTCPTYMRLDREEMKAFQFSKDGFHFHSNQSGGLREVKKTLLVSCGYLGINMLESRSEIHADIVLVEDFSAVRGAKFSSLLNTYERVVCVEEHVISSGLGSCIAKANALSDVEYELIGLEGRQRFGYNNRAELWKANRIDPGSISNLTRGYL